MIETMAREFIELTLITWFESNRKLKSPNMNNGRSLNESLWFKSKVYWSAFRRFNAYTEGHWKVKRSIEISSKTRTYVWNWYKIWFVMKPNQMTIVNYSWVNWINYTYKWMLIISKATPLISQRVFMKPFRDHLNCVVVTRVNQECKHTHTPKTRHHRLPGERNPEEIWFCILLARIQCFQNALLYQAPEWMIVLGGGKKRKLLAIYCDPDFWHSPSKFQMQASRDLCIK